LILSNQARSVGPAAAQGVARLHHRSAFRRCSPFAREGRNAFLDLGIAGLFKAPKGENTLKSQSSRGYLAAATPPMNRPGSDRELQKMLCHAPK
jgi:hypothetical protein